MAATALPFLNLKNLVLTMKSGVIVHCVNVRIKRNPIYIQRPSTGNLLGAQAYNGEDPPDISAEILNDDNISFGEIIPNDPVESFTLLTDEATPASALQDDFFTKWPIAGWAFGELETAFNGSDMSTFTVPIKAGVMNPNEVEA
jgi:hypothetical protein